MEVLAWDGGRFGGLFRQGLSVQKGKPSKGEDIKGRSGIIRLGWNTRRLSHSDKPGGQLPPKFAVSEQC